MKYAFIAAVLVLATAELGYSLKCYNCRSDVSWANCTKEVKTCESDQDRCVAAELIHKDTKIFIRGCTKKKDCDEINEGKNEHLNKCKADKGVCNGKCCESGLCNTVYGAASALVVSGFLIVSCASFIFFQ